MLKDFAKTSPVTFFALPIIIIGMIVLSYFMYSTLITNQINSRQQYIEKQLELSSEHVENQIIQFKKEFPNLADLEDFQAAFKPNAPGSGKFRYRLKRTVNRYRSFVDSVFIYNKEQLYFISIDKKGIIEEGFNNLSSTLLPLQYTNTPKVIHLEGSKLLLMSPLRIGAEQEIYVGAIIDIIKMIGDEAFRQYTGEYSSKIIFTENIGFQTIETGEHFEAQFNLMPHYKKQIIDDILENKQGQLLHKLPHSTKVFMSCYKPFKILNERFGLIFVVSEDDFVAPIKTKLQVIFLSFFVMIAIIIVVFVISLKDITQTVDELFQSKKSLSNALTQQRYILEHGDTFFFTLDKQGTPIYTTKNFEALTGYSPDQWFANLPDFIEENKLEKSLIEKLDLLTSGKLNEDVCYKLKVEKPDQTISIIELKQRAVFDDLGRFEAVICTGKLVTN